MKLIYDGREKQQDKVGAPQADALRIQAVAFQVSEDDMPKA